jgi:hypothetical protein
MSNPVFVDGRLPDESVDLQEVLREMATAINVLAGRVFVGQGSPENVISADKGAVYLRTDGGTSTTLYVKTADAGLATGWTAK